MLRPIKIFVATLILAVPLTAAHAADVTPMQYESVLLDASRKVDVGGCTDVAVVNIPDIRFAFDSADLTSEAYVQMDDLARVVRDRRFVHDRFLLEGHADAKGTDAYNLDLSRLRAETVRRALLSRGITAEKVSTRGYGERRLLYPGDPYHAHNRRVALVVLDAGAVVSDAAMNVDRGNDEMSVQVRLRPQGQGAAFVVDPAVDRFDAGDQFFLCVATSRAGMLEIETRSDSDARFTPLGKWFVSAETLVRAPATRALRVEGAARTETLRLKLITCDASGLGCSGGDMAELRFESIVQGRAKAMPLAVSTPSPSSCDRPGVICREITLKRR
jgi:outer membrane protein OmpA-like peptidoglycan-associated protein